jgi:hypothetical protein
MAGVIVESLRLESVVDFAWGHEYQGIFNGQVGILLLLALPDFVKALATDAAAEMGVYLDGRRVVSFRLLG